MRTLIVTFELLQRNMDYSGLVENIRGYNHARVNSSCFLIHTSDSTKKVYEDLRSFVGSGDTLLVFTVKKRWHGRGQNELVDWVSNKL